MYIKSIYIRNGLPFLEVHEKLNTMGSVKVNVVTHFNRTKVVHTFMRKDATLTLN